MPVADSGSMAHGQAQRINSSPSISLSFAVHSLVSLSLLPRVLGLTSVQGYSRSRWHTLHHRSHNLSSKSTATTMSCSMCSTEAVMGSSNW